jgi:phage gp29-like protein
MMISFKKTVAALRALVPKGLDQTQTGARSMQGGSMNYNSVTTLDPARLASAFAAADMGFIAKQAELFELIEERDPHIFSELAKRRRSVTSLSWQLQPPRDATQSEIDRTNELTDMVKSIEGIEDAQYDLTDAIAKAQ